MIRKYSFDIAVFTCFLQFQSYLRLTSLLSKKIGKMPSKTPSSHFFVFFLFCKYFLVDNFCFAIMASEPLLYVCQSIEEKDHLTVLLLLDKHFEIREFGFPTTAM